MDSALVRKELPNCSAVLRPGKFDSQFIAQQL